MQKKLGKVAHNEFRISHLANFKEFILDINKREKYSLEKNGGRNVFTGISRLSLDSEVKNDVNRFKAARKSEPLIETPSVKSENSITNYQALLLQANKEIESLKKKEIMRLGNHFMNISDSFKKLYLKKTIVALFGNLTTYESEVIYYINSHK